jgi:hypothetical protein
MRLRLPALCRDSDRRIRLSLGIATGRSVERIEVRV